MGKLCSATSLVALILLGCLAGTEVEAQDSVWQRSAPQVAKGVSPRIPQQVGPGHPQSAQSPRTAYVLPPGSSPQLSQWQHIYSLYPPWSNMVSPPRWPEYQTPRPPPLPPFPAWPWYQTRPPKFPQPPPVSPYKTTPPPNVPQPTLPQAPVTPSGANATRNCDVEDKHRVLCGPLGITGDACSAISCCFDGQQCYYGKAVTVQCTKDAQFIVVVAGDATVPNIDFESISLLGGGQGCTYVDSNSGFAIYQFPVTACGTNVTEEPGVIIYENRMISSYQVGLGSQGAITRDSHYELLFQCRYLGTSVETVVVEMLPLQEPPLPVAALGPITVQLRVASGRCTTKGCNEKDVAYSSFYTDTDYPVAKVLRHPVYVEVQLMGKTDPNLILTLGRCWTTTSPAPHTLPQWEILRNGCPYQDDHFMSSLVPVDPSSGLDFPTHYRRFIFKMFTFVDPRSLAPLQENVYIHCSTAVCTATSGISCEPTCARKKRHVKAAEQKTVERRVVASVGPVIMLAPERQTANIKFEDLDEKKH